MPSEKIELLQWLYIAIIAPVFGAIGGWLRSWWMNRAKSKRRKESIIKFLSGLPPESKAVLIDFHQHGTHTRRGDPLDPAIKLLVNAEIIRVGSGGGTYDAIDRYLTIASHIWEVIDDWVISDIESVAAVREQFFEPVNHE